MILLLKKTTMKGTMKMKKMKFFTGLAVMIMSVFTLTACDDDEYVYYYPPSPNALVTVKPLADGGGFYMQLDDKTAVYPYNMKKSPFGDKEVRALASLTWVKRDGGVEPDANLMPLVNVNWIDSIRTKNAVPYPADGNIEEYGDDPIEIVRDWVNIAEDGYLTLRFRTRWGTDGTVHYVNLLTGVNPDDPYEVEFKHNAYGDVNGYAGDALVAFRLGDLPDTQGKMVKLTLKYKSYSGEKSIQFDFCSRESTASAGQTERALYSSRVK